MEFSSERFFQVWFYTVSHSALLIVSNKQEIHSSRIILLFKVVRYISIPHNMKGISVRKLDNSESSLTEIDKVRDRYGYIYEISFTGGAGYILAGSFFMKEDHGEFDHPIPFDINFLP